MQILLSEHQFFQYVRMIQKFSDYIPKFVQEINFAQYIKQMNEWQYFEREDLQTAIQQYPSSEYISLLAQNYEQNKSISHRCDNLISMINRMTLLDNQGSIQNDILIQKFIQEFRDSIDKIQTKIEEDQQQKEKERQQTRQQCSRLIQRYILKQSVIFLSRNKYRRRFTRYSKKYGFELQQLYEFQSHCIYNNKASGIFDLVQGAYHEDNAMRRAYCLMIIKYLRKDFMREILSNKKLQSLKKVMILVKNKLIQKLAMLWSQQIKQQ